jgi:signal transduction histidine kinase
MKLFPRTLFGQIMLVLVASLLAAQVASFWLTLDERARLGDRLRGAYAAQRIAGVISILDNAHSNERIRLLRALNVPPFHLSLSEPWVVSSNKQSEDVQLFIARIEHDLAQPVAIQILPIPSSEVRRRLGIFEPERHGFSLLNDPHFFAIHRDHGLPLAPMLVQAKLSDGTVLTFRHSLPPPNLDWPLQLLGLLCVLLVSFALLTAWVVRRLTRPLASLADTAAKLVDNPEQPAIPETGPLEISRAAKAFNAMQCDLKRYLETRSQALAGVSHDLRLPITRLRLRIEKMADRELKSKIESDLMEMDQMIGDTLAFLRAGSAEEKSVRLDLHALLETIIDDMAIMGANIRMTGKLPRPIHARPQNLRRCLNNLLDNAYRYGGGEIDVVVKEQDNHVEIRIDDNGIGIPASELERVFEPYVRLESSRAKHTGGTGLGLAIARAIARAHGGNIILAARPNGGTSAILTLPITG